MREPAAGTVEGEEPRVDLGFVAGEEAVSSLLSRAAALHGSLVLVADNGGRVVARFGADGGAVPASLEGEGGGGFVREPVVVYDRPCGSLAARGGDAAGAARFASSLLAAFAVRQYETESLSQSLLSSFEEVNLFYGITARLHSVSSPDAICEIILDRACEIVRAARASILMCDPHTGVLRVAAFRGMAAEQAASIRVLPGEGVSGRVMESGQAVLVDDASSLGSRGRSDERYASRSFISVPLRVFHPDEYAGASPPSGSRPLGVLNMTDKEGGVPFTAGDLKLLSALASQAAVLLDNTRLAGIEKEMGLARTIQASLLPQSAPKVPGAELAGICVPAQNVGGDYFDLFTLPGGRSGILVADVSGHNIGAALMMAVSRAALRAEISRAAGPEEVLDRANRLLDLDLARSELFVSVLLAFYDPSTGTLSWASAGHNPGFLRRAATGAVEELDAEGILLGVMPECVFERRTTVLAPGDLVVLYTDGFTEARNHAEQMFGEERFQALLHTVADLPVEAIPRALLKAVDRFTGAAPADDRTAVVLRACTMAAAGGGGRAAPPPAGGEA